MAAKKRKDRPLPVVSTAVGRLINMTLTAVTLGSVLLCLFVVKRSEYSDARRIMTMSYFPLISAIVVALVVLAFTAEASSQ